MYRAARAVSNVERSPRLSSNWTAGPEPLSFGSIGTHFPGSSAPLQRRQAPEDLHHRQRVEAAVVEEVVVGAFPCVGLRRCTHHPIPCQRRRLAVANLQVVVGELAYQYGQHLLDRIAAVELGMHVALIPEDAHQVEDPAVHRPKNAAYAGDASAISAFRSFSNRSFHTMTFPVCGRNPCGATPQGPAWDSRIPSRGMRGA